MAGSVGDVGLQLQWLVQDVVVHLRCVAAVKRRLWAKEKKKKKKHTGLKLVLVVGVII